jgi:hypothetical protein
MISHAKNLATVICQKSRTKNPQKKKKLPAGTSFWSTADSFRGGEEDRQG